MYKRKTYYVSQLISNDSTLPSRNQNLDNVSTNSSLNNIHYTSKDLCVKFNSFCCFVYIFLAAMSSGLISVIVKKVPYIDASQLLFIRSASIFAGVLPIFVYGVIEILGQKEDRFFLLVRALFSATANYLVVIGYRYLPIAEATILISAQPVATAVLAHLWLRESCGLVLIISLVITILGLLTSVRLPEILSNRDSIPIGSSYFGGLAAVVTTVLMRAFSTVFLRRLKHVHFSVPLVYAGSVGIIESIAINTATSSFVMPDCGWDQLLFLSVGILGFTETAWSTMAFLMQPAGIVTVIKASFDIIISVALQILFFYEYPDKYVTSGACLVMISIGFMGFKTWLLMQSEDSKVRKNLKCFEN